MNKRPTPSITHALLGLLFSIYATPILAQQYWKFQRPAAIMQGGWKKTPINAANKSDILSQFDLAISSYGLDSKDEYRINALRTHSNRSSQALQIIQTSR